MLYKRINLVQSDADVSRRVSRKPSLMHYICFALFILTLVFVSTVIERQREELRAITVRAEETGELAQWQAEQTRVAFDRTMDFHQRINNEEED